MLTEYFSGFFWILGALSAIGTIILVLLSFMRGVREWADRRK